MSEDLSLDHEEDGASRGRKRLVIAVGAVLAAAATAFGVVQIMPSGDGEPAAADEDAPAPQLTATDVANEFLSALTTGQARRAARLTDDEPAAPRSWRGTARSTARPAPRRRPVATPTAGSPATATTSRSRRWSRTRRRRRPP